MTFTDSLTATHWNAPLPGLGENGLREMRNLRKRLRQTKPRGTGPRGIPNRHQAKAVIRMVKRKQKRLHAAVHPKSTEDGRRKCGCQQCRRG